VKTIIRAVKRRRTRTTERTIARVAFFEALGLGELGSSADGVGAWEKTLRMLGS
jgi:hypothetical protein